MDRMDDAPVKMGETYVVSINSMGEKGDGIARVKGFVLFVALPISEALKTKIEPILLHLQELGSELKVVSSHNLHFTLKFLGELEDDKINEIKNRLSSLIQGYHRFSIRIKGLQVFPSYEQINIISLGAESPELIQLMKKINEELNDLRPETRKEIPHLTRARVKFQKNKEKLTEFLQSLVHRKFAVMPADKIILYESRLAPSGPVYSIIEEFILSS